MVKEKSVTVDVITLVHGTFAPGAPWTKSGSEIRATLERLFPTARIQDFEWSGKNSHHARVEAGDALADFLEKQIDEQTGSVHAIVAHSHGGNVALYALRRPRVSTAVRKLVFLSTPFIHCYPRNVRKSFSVLAHLVTWIVVPGISLMVVSFLVFLLSLFSSPVLGLLGSIALGIFNLIFLVWYFVFFGWSYVFIAIKLTALESLEAARESLYGKISTPVPNCAWLAVYTTWDEALVWLKTLNYASSIPVLVWALLMFVLRKMFWVVLATLLVLPLITKLVYDDGELGLDAAGKILLAPYGLACAGAVVIYVATVFFTPALRGTMLGFGGENSIHTAVLSIHSSSLPQGFSNKHSARHLVVKPQQGSGRSLRHSFAYSDKTTIDCIASWLAGSHVAAPTGEPRLSWAARKRMTLLSGWVLFWAVCIGENFIVYKELASISFQRSLSELFAGRSITPWASSERDHSMQPIRKNIVSIDHQLIQPNSQIDLPFEVNKNLQRDNCYISGRYKADGSTLVMRIMIDDWPTKAKADAAISTNREARDIPGQPNAAVEIDVVTNYGEHEGESDFAFDKRLIVRGDFSDRGRIYIRNLETAQATPVSLTVSLDCYAENFSGR
jgi:hypothetical protein